MFVHLSGPGPNRKVHLTTIPEHQLVIDTGADMTVKARGAPAAFKPTGGTTTICGATNDNGSTATFGNTLVELQSRCGAWLLVEFRGTAEGRLASDEMLLSIGQYHNNAPTRSSLETRRGPARRLRPGARG